MTTDITIICIPQVKLVVEAKVRELLVRELLVEAKKKIISLIVVFPIKIWEWATMTELHNDLHRSRVDRRGENSKEG